MGREVRHVPSDWQHPKDSNEDFIPLLSGKQYKSSVADWDEECEKWERGEFPDYANDEHRKLNFTEWAGERPKAENYMPDWYEEECTHYMMYENTTEGTPISPVFATAEELAQWLVDNQASEFGSTTASYEGWLRIAQGGYACSAVYSSENGLQSGVDAIRP